jgi:DNA invertase Pin-like site-specific DNA recombinase
MPKRKALSRREKNVAVIYVRVSTDEQVKGTSLEHQERECRKLCAREGWVVDRVFVDRGASAKTAEREEFRKMIRYCSEYRHRIGYVVVLNCTRFARRNSDHQFVRMALSKEGIQLRSVQEPIDETSTGRLIENMAAAYAEFDNSRRTENTVAGMRTKAEHGFWQHPTPIGFEKIGSKKDARLVPDPMRAPLIRQAFEMYASGLYDARRVLDAVTKAGLRTRRGKKLTLQTFHKMLRRALYAGRLENAAWGIVVKAQAEAIVDPGVFDRVQDVLSGKRPVIATYQRNHPAFPLRWFVRCAACDTPLTASFAKNDTRTTPAVRRDVAPSTCVRRKWSGRSRSNR